MSPAAGPQALRRPHRPAALHSSQRPGGRLGRLSVLLLFLLVLVCSVPLFTLAKSRGGARTQGAALQETIRCCLGRGDPRFYLPPCRPGPACTNQRRSLSSCGRRPGTERLQTELGEACHPRSRSSCRHVWVPGKPSPHAPEGAPSLMGAVSRPPATPSTGVPRGERQGPRPCSDNTFKKRACVLNK